MPRGAQQCEPTCTYDERHLLARHSKEIPQPKYRFSVQVRFPAFFLLLDDDDWVKLSDGRATRRTALNQHLYIHVP